MRSWELGVWKARENGSSKASNSSRIGFGGLGKVAGRVACLLGAASGVKAHTYTWRKNECDGFMLL